MQATEPGAVLEDVKLTAKRIFSLIATELGQVESEFERQAFQRSGHRLSC